jgi:hypothetical protein
MKRSLFTLALLMAAGCKAYKIDPPPGFAEVSSDSTGARMIGGEHVGLHLRVFHNVPGGTLTFWSQDLVRKLAERKYVLTRQTAVKSGNGVAGTRFDFDYVNPDGDAKFYSVVVFATNEHLFALQMAGDAEIADRFRAQLEDAIEDTKVRGCRPWGGRPCRGPQPPPLSTPPLPAEEEPAAEDEAEPMPVAEDEAKPKSEAKPKDEAKPKSDAKPKTETTP